MVLAAGHNKSVGTEKLCGVALLFSCWADQAGPHYTGAVQCTMREGGGGAFPSIRRDPHRSKTPLIVASQPDGKETRAAPSPRGIKVPGPPSPQMGPGMPE
jgi:hypothetical protein